RASARWIHASAANRHGSRTTTTSPGRASERIGRVCQNPRMDYRKLGESGVLVSPLCLGTMMFGDRTDAKEAALIVATARDPGINFIDTADVYAKGESERITGKVIASDRDRWVLATKVANPMGGDPNRRGTGRKWILTAIDESLERLATD